MTLLLWLAFVIGWVWSYLLSGILLALLWWMGRRAERAREAKRVRFRSIHQTPWALQVLPGINARPAHPLIERREPERFVRVVEHRN